MKNLKFHLMTFLFFVALIYTQNVDAHFQTCQSLFVQGFLLDAITQQQLARTDLDLKTQKNILKTAKANYKNQLQEKFWNIKEIKSEIDSILKLDLPHRAWAQEKLMQRAILDLEMLKILSQLEIAQNKPDRWTQKFLKQNLQRDLNLESNPKPSIRYALKFYWLEFRRLMFIIMLVSGVQTAYELYQHPPQVQDFTALTHIMGRLNVSKINEDMSKDYDANFKQALQMEYLALNQEIRELQVQQSDPNFKKTPKKDAEVKKSLQQKITEKQELEQKYPWLKAVN